MLNKASVTSVAMPEIGRSKEGYEFNPAEDHWTLVDQAAVVHFWFGELRRYCADGVVDSHKMVLLHYIENYSLSHSKNMQRIFLHLCRSLNNENGRLERISTTVILNYKAHLGKQHEWYLGAIKGFFKKWKGLGYWGVDDDAIRLLDDMTLSGNRKGDAVRTWDPEKGPFTENELLSIHEALCDQYRQGDIGNRELALVWLFLALGQRLVQFSMLKIKDFEPICAEDGSIRYFINVPRAKQRGVLARELFKRRSLCDEAGEALLVWIEQVKSSPFASSEGTAVGELPIFPRWGNETTIGRHHMVAQALGKELTRILKKLGAISERTGDPIKFTSKRFKYTIGTRAAEEGHGEMVIAELLDQSDTQNVHVYTESTSKVAGIIDKAMAPFLAPVAQAFKGMIIRSDSECPDGARISTGNPNTKDVGKCGNHGFCNAAAPHVCYVCVNFNPWIDGPHEEVLKELLDERERVLANTGDERIAGAKDRLILAVTQVVNMCAEMKQMEEVVNG